MQVSSIEQIGTSHCRRARNSGRCRNAPPGAAMLFVISLGVACAQAQRRGQVAASDQCKASAMYRYGNILDFHLGQQNMHVLTSLNCQICGWPRVLPNIDDLMLCVMVCKTESRKPKSFVCASMKFLHGAPNISMSVDQPVTADRSNNKPELHRSRDSRGTH